jgi:DDE superfamily endonuclease
MGLSSLRLDRSTAKVPPAAAARGGGEHHHHPPGLEEAGLPLEAAQVRVGSSGSLLAPGQGGLKRGLKGRKRTVVLFTDATIITETSRARWTRIGEQARVPITGNRDKRVLYGTMNPKTGEICLDQDSFQKHLRHVRAKWRGWHIVLFLDRGSPHTAKGSRRLAQELGIEVRWLPVACPELNPLEGIWRHLKGDGLANRATLWMAELMERAVRYIQSLSPLERLSKAGVLSGNFWLAT